jgi:hypothetical protein
MILALRWGLKWLILRPTQSEKTSEAKAEFQHLFDISAFYISLLLTVYEIVHYDSSHNKVSLTSPMTYHFILLFCYTFTLQAIKWPQCRVDLDSTPPLCKFNYFHLSLS